MIEVSKNYRGKISEELNPYDFIPKSEYNKKNKERSWEYKEYPEYDINFICISKDGTIGKVFKIEDLIIALPSSTLTGSVKGLDEDGSVTKVDYPKSIVNEGKRPKNAKWKRNEEHLKAFEDVWFRYKSRMSKEKAGSKRQSVRNQFVVERNSLLHKHADFVDAEFERREHGIFVKIDTEVHYLTGSNWMFLQHYYLTESDIYPDFRMVQTEAYWHWEAVKADSRCWGEIRGKGRRSSWTVEAASEALDVFSIYKYANIPIVSERKDLAAKLFTGKIVESFEYFPIYFKPLIELPNQKAKSELEIQFETDRKETANISFYPTKETAYDSTKVKPFSINDEVGKWEECSLTAFISRHSKCHTNGGGKAKFGSTAGEYFKGGGQEFEAEFKNANANERNKITGRTANGLVSFFIDYCYTMTEPKEFFDEWGYSVVFDPEEPILSQKGEWLDLGAESYWKATYEQLVAIGEKKAINGFLRDSPRSISHMFRNEGGKNNDFDITNLNNHLQFLEEMLPQDLNEVVFRGNLEYEGEKFKSKVRWIPHTKGKFKTSWIPPKELQNKSSLRDFHGRRLRMPDNNHIGAFGVDSYDISETVNKNGSNGTISGHTKTNMTGAPIRAFFLEYCERPDKRDDFYDDVIMACEFFGMFALVENNKPRLLEYMTEHGYRGFSMTRPDKKWKDLSQFEKDNGGIPASKQGNNDQATLLKDYIFDNIGVNLDQDCKTFSKERIQEWIDFDVNKRKTFDLAVADQLALLACQYNTKQRKVVGVGQDTAMSLQLFEA
jgi:hypothetical protein